MSHRLFIILLCLFGVNVSPVHAVMCDFLGAPSPWVSYPRYYFSEAAAWSACLSYAADHGKQCNGPYDCSNSSTGDCSWRSGYIEYWVDHARYQYSQDQFLYCAGTLTDTDGDGIPDSRDPCPNNPNPDCTAPRPDTDGDGTPDEEDPCPNNPDPDCTDPNDPPTDPNDPPKPPPPDIPGEIVIGDCTVDISQLKAWLLSDDSFPFNFMWRIYSIFSPLFSMEPQAPVIETAIPLDPSLKYSWIPDSYAISINFSFLDPIALVVRQLEILGMAYIFALYGFHRYRSFAGV